MYFCLDAAGPILLWFMVGFQQIHFLAGRELTLTGLICLVLNQSVNQLINQSISYSNYKSAMQVSVQWVCQSVRKIKTKIWFINGVDNVNWPPYRDWKADVSSVSPSSEQIDLLWRRANVQNVSFSISVRWSIYIINSVDKPNFRVSLPHRRSTTVSLETNPLWSER